MAQTISNARPSRLTREQYVDGVLSGDRVILARAITVVESDLPNDEELAAEILNALLPYSGKSRRIGITGVPGAGKSTLIEALGLHLIRDRSQKLAVLSIDPSSPVSGGSILGDKTRMERLSLEDNAYIRPSPARGHLGGVSRRTRQAILVCEAAGFENILVETVGVGQSETAVRAMTDFFLLLILANAGDELQRMKRGIIEMIDGLAVTKADGDYEQRAERARAEYSNALHLFAASPGGWTPSVITVSSLTGKGIAELWETILEHRRQMELNGLLLERRRTQALDWMRELISTGLEQVFRDDPEIATRLSILERAVQDGQTAAPEAARSLLERFRNRA